MYYYVRERERNRERERERGKVLGSRVKTSGRMWRLNVMKVISRLLLWKQIELGLVPVELLPRGKSEGSSS